MMLPIGASHGPFLFQFEPFNLQALQFLPGGVPVAERWLERRRPTGTQTRLGSADRRRNLSQAFAVGKEFKSGAPVVLVDDVLTTGATLSACAAVLLSAGASSVRGLCLAWAGDA